MKPRLKIIYEFVSTLPKTLDYGVLYISEQYRTTAHLCACGCRYEVQLALGAGAWSYQIDGNNRISMSPSIGNSSYPCKSHYFIAIGSIAWCTDMTPGLIAAARFADNPRAHQPGPEPRRGFLQPLWDAIARLIGSLVDLLKK